MTTENILQTAGQGPGRFRLPDPPERDPDEVTASDHLSLNGNASMLAAHLGNRETTLVTAERWIVASPNYNRARARRPDLLVAFDVSPADYKASNGYIISEQGKPPDFVLEIASPSTAQLDTGDKRDDYAALGIPREYWRFDETGEDHGARLAGDILVGGVYRPIPIEELEPGILQGYSAALILMLRWDHGELVWWDPVVGAPILTYEDQRARADQAEARARELEREMQRLRGEPPP